MASLAADPATVPPMFTSKNPSDCILRSSDGLEFHVLRGILIYASDVFKDMFSLPATGTDTEPGELPIIEMAESGSVLSALLSIIYPVIPPRITDVSLAVELLRAWKKYFMSMERLQPFLAELFSESSLLERPLDVYALAWRMDNATEARRASRYSHGVELSAHTMLRLFMLSGDSESLTQLIEMRERRKQWLKCITLMVPIRECACPNHGGGDNGAYDRIAYMFHQKEMETQVESALSKPHLEICRDFRDFLALRDANGDKRWPGSALSKRCSHPTNNYCFGNMDPDQVREISGAIESLKLKLPMEIIWPK